MRVWLAVISLSLQVSSAYAQAECAGQACSVCDQVAGAANLSVGEQKELGSSLVAIIAELGRSDPAAADAAAQCVASAPAALLAAYQLNTETATAAVGSPSDSSGARTIGIGDPDPDASDQ